MANVEQMIPGVGGRKIILTFKLSVGETSVTEFATIFLNYVGGTQLCKQLSSSSAVGERKIILTFKFSVGETSVS